MRDINAMVIQLAIFKESRRSNSITDCKFVIFFSLYCYFNYNKILIIVVLIER